MSEMQALAILVLIFIMVVVLIIIMISIYRNNRIMKKAQNAAKILVRGEILDGVIEGKTTYGMPEMRRMLMIQIFNPSKRYVFDPEKSINIGRSANWNQIVIQDMRVSEKHCRIYKKKDQIILEDMKSANGTFVKRRLKKIKVEKRMELRNADKVVIGDTMIQVYPFYVNTVFM